MAQGLHIIQFSKSLLLYIILSWMFSLLVGCAKPGASYNQAKFAYYAHDYNRAFQKLWPAVQANDPKALYALGYMYYYGQGTEKDLDLGRGLIRRAAEQNYPPAVCSLKIITAANSPQNAPFQPYDCYRTLSLSHTFKGQG